MTEDPKNALREAPSLWGLKSTTAAAVDDPDVSIRTKAFEHLSELSRIYDHIPAVLLASGFDLNGEKISLMTRARGIFKPRQMKTLLSIATVMPRAGRAISYEDQNQAHREVFDGDDTVTYAFQRGSVDSASNQLLKDAEIRGIPVVYFLGVAPAVYKAIFPVFICKWDEDKRTVQLLFGDTYWPAKPAPATVDDRRYGLKLAKQRLHQTLFRKAVIEAYGGAMRNLGPAGTIAAGCGPYHGGFRSRLRPSGCFKWSPAQ